MLKEILKGFARSNGEEWFGAIACLVWALIFWWPWLWCVGVCLFNLILLPLTLTLDGFTTIWRSIRPQYYDHNAATLRRIQREMESLSREPEGVQRICPVCLDDFEPDSEAGLKKMPCGHRFHR